MMQAKAANMDELLDTKEVASIVKVRPATIRRWERDGKFPAPFLRGAITRWRRSDIANWLEKGQAG